MTLPLPLDLASVAWVAMHEYHPNTVRFGGDWPGDVWVDRERYAALQSERNHHSQRAADLQIVVRDQQRHIKLLEAQLRPSLVQAVEP